MKNFKNVTKRGLAMLLALVMIVGAMSLTAFAAEEEHPVDNVLNSTVDKTDEVFVTPDSKDAEDLTDAVDDAKESANLEAYDKLNEKVEEFKTDLDEAVKGAAEIEVVMEDLMDEEGNPVLDKDGNVVKTPKLDEDGNPVTKSVESEKETALDQYVANKTSEVDDAARKAQDAKKDATDALKNATTAAQKGDVEAAKSAYVDASNAYADAASAYAEAQVAYTQAQAAVDAAQAKYDAAIRTALGLTTDEPVPTLDNAVNNLNTEITAANKALSDAKSALESAYNGLAKADEAKNVAAKYQTIANALKDQDDPAEIQKILGQIENLEEGKTVLDALWVENAESDKDKLVNEAIDYVKQEQAIQAKQDALDELERNQDALDAADLISGLVTDIKFLGDNSAYAFDGINKKIAECKELLDDAHAILRNPSSDQEQITRAQAMIEAALDKLTEGRHGYDQGVSIYSDISTKTFAKDENKTLKDQILQNLNKLHDLETSMRDKEYDKQVADAKQDVSVAQAKLSTESLNKALAAYNASLGKDNGTGAADAASTSSKLAAILLAASEEYVENAKQLAAEKASEAQAAADALSQAQLAYNQAMQTLNKAMAELQTQDLDKLSALRNKLDLAKEKLEQAKADKDAAEDSKKDADDAVTKAEEIRDAIIRDLDNDDFGGDDEVEIDDEAVPLAAGPVTRAEFVDYLWRHEGEPEAPAPTFADVPADHDFAPAIGWAQSIGLVAGNEKGEFEPDELVTVAAVRTILTRFAAYAGMTMPELTTLTGGDGEAVLNCDAVLAEFFGEDLAELAA